MDGGLTFFPQPWVVTAFEVDDDSCWAGCGLAVLSTSAGGANTTAVDERDAAAAVNGAWITAAPAGNLGALGFGF